MAEKKRNWLLIILGIVVVVVILGVAAVVGFGYWMYRQMEITTTTTGNIEQEFADVRARFQGKVPYVEISMDDQDKAVVHHELEKGTRTPLQHLRLVAYDEREHRLVRLTIPFWLVRLGKNKEINLSAGRSGFDPGVRLSVTPEDIERFGPGLIIDGVGRRGERFIIWAE
jgi:hypothetical protein